MSAAVIIMSLNNNRIRSCSGGNKSPNPKKPNGCGYILAFLIISAFIIAGAIYLNAL
jgi:hypothetical protein